MRKSFMLVALATVALAVAGSAGASRHAGTFKYCTDPTFPPMELATASGKITGFDVDMAQKLALTWGANAIAVKTAFPGLIPALNAKKCDAVISGIFVTPDRKKQAGVAAYMESHRVLVVKAGNPKGITSPNALKGKVVVYDFWTYSCINCIRTIPHLQALYARYHAQGLEIVGIHSPEFDFEKDHGNIAAAVTKLGVTWPVAFDDNMAVWHAFGNQYWPAEYLADPDGKIRSVHFGEGDYSQKEDEVRALLGVDASAIAEQRTQARKGECHHSAERKEDEDRDRSKPPVQVEEHAQSNDRSEDSSSQLNESRANQVPDALRVGHDARNQHAGLRRIEIRDRQVKNVGLDVLTHIGYRALRGNAHDLRQRVCGDRLNDHGGGSPERQRNEQVGAVLPDYVIEKELGARRNDEPRTAIHEHDREADRERPAMPPDELSCFGPGSVVIDFRGCLLCH